MTDPSASIKKVKTRTKNRQSYSCYYKQVDLKEREKEKKDRMSLSGNTFQV